MPDDTGDHWKCMFQKTPVSDPQGTTQYLISRCLKFDIKISQNLYTLE